MSSFGLKNVQIVNSENFTSNMGIKMRRIINKPLKGILKVATGKKIIIDRYPELEKDEQYIFASTHYFNEDIIAGMAALDRPAYVLIGTTDQVENNPLMNAAWLYGLIYVDRLNTESRKDSVKKMERILNNGSSILMFPEGGWNNTENLLCQTLFAGPYTLAKQTGKKVVAISTFSDPDSKEIHIQVSDPIDLKKMEKEEALSTLRDTMASQMYDSIEKHSIPLERANLSGDIHLQHMENRKKEYLKVKWTRDVWDEELTVYQSKSITTPAQVRESLKDVNITPENANLIAPILTEYEEDKKHDFKIYMKKNWNK